MNEILSEEREEHADWHPLSESEAHDEANMMRAKMGIRPHRKGTILDTETEPRTLFEEHRKAVYGGIDRKPTQEDYDKAFQVIEQLKEAAASETDFQKIAYKLLRGANRAVQDLLLAGGVIGSLGYNARDFFKWRKEALATRFQDAEKKLRDLMKSGEEFGKYELKYGETTEEQRKPKAA